MQIEESVEGDCLIVRLREQRLDAVISANLREALVAYIDQGRRHIVFDMSQVSFIDSSGLGAVVSVLKHMGSQGKFHLVSVTPAVMAVLRLTRMDRVFKIFNTRQEALAA